MKRKRILTGDRPTGPMHLGHYVGSLKNRVRLQDEHDCFFIIADYQVLTDHLNETERTQDSVRDVVLDWLSVGMDPEKSTFFIQSMVPEIAELTMYFSMLASVSRLQRNPTVMEEFREAGLRSMSYGFLGYPVSQAADILAVRADLVPVGEDNVPHVEQTREIARTFNRTFGKTFPVPQALVGDVSRLPGLDGRKMGVSLGNAIFLKDTPEQVRTKIRSAITDPARVKSTDPGHPDVCNIYAYYEAFAGNSAPDVRERCTQGRVGCVACKENLAARINAFLEPVREKRVSFESRPAIVTEALGEGTARTRREAAQTMRLVREAVHFDYRELLSEREQERVFVPEEVG